MEDQKIDDIRKLEEQANRDNLQETTQRILQEVSSIPYLRKLLSITESPEHRQNILSRIEELIPDKHGTDGSTTGSKTLDQLYQEAQQRLQEAHLRKPEGTPETNPKKIRQNTGKSFADIFNQKKTK